MIVKCPSCERESAGGKFCSWCATPLNAASAETELMLAAAAPARASTSAGMDEGQFLPGTVLAGRYRITGLLGRGGMGEVYRATDLTLAQAVALKFLPERLARDERALVRFYNEVRTARQVTHPNVCRVYDIGQVEGVPYISMEFVDGEDLASLLRRIGRLPVDKALETARKLCAGLAAAHERGVLHRDLKPANIMIDSRGQIIIMDFGLAGLSEQLQADVRSGTPAYMSPEQLAGTEVTIKSDIYALGLVLYELFTGKRAFEAASLMELMEMQQRAAPASLASTVKEIDPVVERVILRCLAYDPAQRPASALAVAAALPGGDPLAQALAAGETPSPELVAAAGETEDLEPKIALAWLVAAVVAIAAVAVVAPKRDLTAMLHLENPPEALARDARTMLSTLGYTARPGDAAWGMDYSDDYRDYLKRHPDEAATRWRNLSEGDWPLAQFWYRESRGMMIAQFGTNVSITPDDPPMIMSGMARVDLSPDSKLMRLEVVPPQVEPPAPAASFDWNRIFQAAGLDMAQFQPVEPQWTPLANWDQRAAWTRGRLRVEAAAWRGKPVSFRLIGPWSTPERTQAPRGDAIGLLMVIYGALISACMIAWMNWRAGRVDLHGAAKLAVPFFACYAVWHFLLARHSATQSEIDLFWKAVSNSGINAGAIWVFYLALEPWVRRRWPQTMISWSRYLVKGVRDPLVGRDLLFAVPIAAGMVLLTAGYYQFLRGEPQFPRLQALNGTRFLTGEMLMAVTNGLFLTLLLFFVLFLLRWVLRNQWIALTAFMGIFVAVEIGGSSHFWQDAVYLAIFAAIWAGVLLRFGLLATMAVDAVRNVLENIPHTLDTSAWYMGSAMLPIILILGLAFYGFRIALAGRRLIRAVE